MDFMPAIIFFAVVALIVVLVGRHVKRIPKGTTSVTEDRLPSSDNPLGLPDDE
jgi:hypothetical protein